MSSSYILETEDIPVVRVPHRLVRMLPSCGSLQGEQPGGASRFRRSTGCSPRRLKSLSPIVKMAAWRWSATPSGPSDWSPEQGARYPKRFGEEDWWRRVASKNAVTDSAHRGSRLVSNPVEVGRQTADDRCRNDLGDVVRVQLGDTIAECLEPSGTGLELDSPLASLIAPAIPSVRGDDRAVQLCVSPEASSTIVLAISSAADRSLNVTTTLQSSASLMGDGGYWWPSSLH